MSKIAIVGGSGLTQLASLEIIRRDKINTPYGPPSGDLVQGSLAGNPVVFLARHGDGHSIPPHRINYRANIWALKQAGVQQIIAVFSVGALNQILPGEIAFPDQIIDYTHSRAHTFFDDETSPVTHIDFTEPYCPKLREILQATARELGIVFGEGGTYGASQGPRLETAAEIRRMRQDGCDYVGMTGMPEAALARELGMTYAACVVVANQAAGMTPGEISVATMNKILEEGMENVRVLVRQVLEKLRT